MKFLLDQDVYAATARLLRGLGHDALTAAELGLAQASDLQLIAVARERRRVFVTRDRDFGELVFLSDIRTGVIYLRVLPSTQQAVHAELAKIVQDYSEVELMTAFLVVEPGRHRFRRLQIDLNPSAHAT